jgi:hypothetical protein
MALHREATECPLEFVVTSAPLDAEDFVVAAPCSVHRRIADMHAPARMA